LVADAPSGISGSVTRTTEFLTHPVFNVHHSETQLLRYMHMLASKDLALDRAMIPLGSCTMKLNATAALEPISWPEFAYIHPFAPSEQTAGYQEIIADLERWLSSITGYQAFSLQPNAGSQGEFAGLLAIAAYHRSRGDDHRNICLIPASAHGTNPASAVMAGMEVIVVATTDMGEIDLDDLRAKAEQHAESLAAIMITYPSTNGVFEETVGEVCEIVHDHGGQVYVDGANLNALVGLAKPGHFGGDVSHLNLHKTFSIPHGGGGPGIGPIGVGAHLAPFLPGHPELDLGTKQGPVAAAPYGSAGVLPVPWVYIHMLGKAGLRRSTEIAILNANYIAKRLSDAYPVLYTGTNGFVAHECIIDIRPITHDSGVTVDDIAKRLIDYGFHAPTMSFPVAGTLMIEPTESESKQELDRFIDAMLQIRDEIAEVESGSVSVEESVLRHAPHPARDMMSEDWERAYPRMQGAYPGSAHTGRKYWPPVSRIDGGYGDRHLVCSCVPIEDYA
jgi:glycine dehydrogenase